MEESVVMTLALDLKTCAYLLDVEELREWSPSARLPTVPGLARGQI